MPFQASPFLATSGSGRKIGTYQKNQQIFSQGDKCCGLFYLQDGRVKISITSLQGKEGVVAILGPGDFLGEGCLAGQENASATATVLTENAIVMHIERERFRRTLRSDPKFADSFLRYVLSRNVHFEEDLIDQLFNSSEKRLARVLLLMARYENPGDPEPIIPGVTQETLAEMVGTTRSRISKFMNKFRELGFIEYDEDITVRRSLLAVVLHNTTPNIQ
jgi:CRP/FNR family cyclic AMP-dependent transcriptional regulator